MQILKLDQVNKIYEGEHEQQVLKNVSFSLEKGAFVALTGPSGSGKTTLLNIAAGLDSPSSGDVILLGQNLTQLSLNQKSKLRRNHLGFVFQSFNLIPTLKVHENVELTCLLRQESAEEARFKAEEALRTVGLFEHRHKFPNQLSGGQQQRTAVARALAASPALIFADEPTANLDSKTAHQVIELFQYLNKEQNISFLFSTHDIRLSKTVKSCFEIEDGQIKN